MKTVVVAELKAAQGTRLSQMKASHNVVAKRASRIVAKNSKEMVSQDNRILCYAMLA
jgi:hypothetical protein